MTSDKSVPYEKWVSMRKRTMVIFTIQMILLGMDYFVTFLTLWMYIKELVNTKHPLIYFGVVSVSYVLSSTIFPTIIGCFVDRTRKVRLAFYSCNTLAILGNLLYIQNFFPLVPGGRSLPGRPRIVPPIGDMWRDMSVVSSERLEHDVRMHGCWVCVRDPHRFQRKRTLYGRRHPDRKVPAHLSEHIRSLHGRSLRNRPDTQYVYVVRPIGRVRPQKSHC
jgi:hypothetical protein